MEDEDDEAFLPPGFLNSQPDDCGIGALEAEITAEIRAGRNFLDTISPRSSAQESSDKVLELFTGNQANVNVEDRRDERIRELQEDKANLIIETQKLELDLAMEKEEAQCKLKSLEDDNERLTTLIENHHGTQAKLYALEERSKTEALEKESREQTLLKQVEKLASENFELQEALSNERSHLTKLEQDLQSALPRIEEAESARLQAEEQSARWQKFLADKRTNLDGTIRSLQRKMGAIEAERQALEEQLVQQTKALEALKESDYTNSGLVDSLRRADEKILLMAEKIQWYESEMEEKEDQLSDLKERNAQHELEHDETELQRKLRSKLRRIGSLEAELEASKEQYLEQEAVSQTREENYRDEVASLNSRLRKLEESHEDMLCRSKEFKDRERDLKTDVRESGKTISTLQNRLENLQGELQSSLRIRDSLESQQAAFVDQASQLQSLLAAWLQVEGKDDEKNEIQPRQESLVGVAAGGQQDLFEPATTIFPTLFNHMETLRAQMLTSAAEFDSQQGETLRLQSDVCDLQSQLAADRESLQREHQTMLELEREEHKEELSRILRDKYQTAEVARRAMEDVNKMVKTRLGKSEREIANLNDLLQEKGQVIASLESKIRDLSTLLVHPKTSCQNKQNQEQSKIEASDNTDLNKDYKSLVVPEETSYKDDGGLEDSSSVSPIPELQLSTLHAAAESNALDLCLSVHPVEKRLDESASSYDSFLVDLETANNRPQISFKPIAAEFDSGSRIRTRQPTKKSVPSVSKRDLPPSGPTVRHQQDAITQSPNSAFQKTKNKAIPSSHLHRQSLDRNRAKSANQSSLVHVAKIASSASMNPKGRRTSMLPKKTATQKFSRITRPSGLIPAATSKHAVEELKTKRSSKAKSNSQEGRTAGIRSDRGTRASIGSSSRSKPLDTSIPTPSSRGSNKTQSKLNRLHRSETKQGIRKESETKKVDKEKPQRTIPGGHGQRSNELQRYTTRKKSPYKGQSSLDSLLKENRANKKKDLLRTHESSAIRSKSIERPVSGRRNLPDSPHCSSESQHYEAFLTTPGRIKRRLVGSFSPETPLVSPKKCQREACHSDTTAATLIQSTWRSTSTPRQLVETNAAVVAIPSFTEARTACTDLRENKLQSASNLFQFAVVIQRWWRMKKTEVGYRTTIDSVVVIQRLWRGVIGRVSFRILQLEAAAATRIQSSWRSRRAVKLLTKCKQVVITLQSFTRVHLACCALRHLQAQRSKMVQAVVSVQGWWRMAKCRAEYGKAIRSVVVIQKGARGIVIRSSFKRIQLENRRAAVIIQARVRRFQQQRQYRNFVAKCRTIQRFIRRSKQEQSFAQQMAAIRIQSRWRSSRGRKMLMTAKAAAVTLQSFARMRAASSTVRDILSQRLAMIHSATLVQCWWRMEICRTDYEKKIRSAIVVQNGMRSVIRRLRLRQARSESRRSAVIIQASVRRLQQQRQYRNYVDKCRTIQRFIRRSKQSFAQQMAAIRIQSRWRSSQDRKMLMRAKAAAVTLQSFATLVVALRRAELENSAKCLSTLLIQSWWRAERCRSYYATSITSVIIIQKHMRGVAARIAFRDFLLESRSVLVLQSNVKRHLARRRFEDMRRATIRIQSQWRMRCVAKSFSRAKHAVITLQSIARARGALFLLHQLQSDQHSRALLIQAWWRMTTSRLGYEKQIRSAVILQKGVRRMFSRMLFTEKQLATRSAVVIQAMVRSHLYQSSYQGKVKALRIIQRWSRRANRRIYIRKSAAVRIQSKYRSRRACNLLSRAKGAVILLQCLTRSRNAYRYSNFLRLQAAKRKLVCKTVLIQSWWRMEFCRSGYVKFPRSAVAIQKNARSFLCRISYHQIVQSACVIQAGLRGSLARRSCREKIEMCVIIQKWIRRTRKTIAQQTAATLIQSNWRTKNAKNLLSTVKRAAITLQAFARARAAFFFVRLRRSTMAKAADLIQRFWRMETCRRQYLNRIRSVVAIQTGARRMLNRVAFIQSQLEEKSALVIQVRVRSWFTIQVYKEKIRACCAIQGWYRNSRKSILQRNAATCIQSKWRKRSAVEFFLRRKHAAISIQSFARLCASRSIVHSIQSEYFNKVKSAIVIQRCWRKERSRAAYLKLIRATALVQRCSRGMIGRSAAANLRKSVAASSKKSVAPASKKKAAPKAKQSTLSVSKSKPRQVLGGLSEATASSRSKRSAANRRSDNVANTSKMGIAEVSVECLKPAASVKRVTRSKATVRDEETSAQVEHEEASARSDSIRNEVSKLKVVDLRAELNSMGVPTKDYRVLRKAQLIEMLVEKRLAA